MRDKWKSINLVKIADIKRGLPSQDLNYVENTNEGIRLIRINDFKSDSPKYIIETEKTQKLTIKKGDILIAGTGATAGISFLVNDLWDGLPFSYNAPRIRVKKGNDKNYVYYILNSSKIKQQQNRLFTGNAQPFLDTRAIGSFKIPLPPLPEQQKIAEILSTVDAKIEIIDQQITETQELKKGLMQQLLTKGIGHTEFKDSVLGKIPKSWEVVKISKVADVKGGKRIPKGESLTEEKTSHPYIRVADMFMGGVSLEKILYVPENIFPIIKKYTISKDDLFISVAGTLGIVGEIPNELDGANLTENADKLSNIKISKLFLLQVLLSPIIQTAIEREKTNNAQPKLALAKIRSFEIPKPSKEEQLKIAEILSTTDKKLEVLLEKKTTYQELKQGLMQQLLTGKVRV